MTIREEIDRLFRAKDDIVADIKRQQGVCPHVVSVYEAGGSGPNYDGDSYYWYSFYCYDCRKRWTKDQDKGSGNSLKVSKIDYDKNPEIVELEIKIAGMR